MLAIQPSVYANCLNLGFFSCNEELPLQQRLCKFFSDPSCGWNEERYSNFAMFEVTRQAWAMTSQQLIYNRPLNRQSSARSRSPIPFKDSIIRWVLQLTLRLAVASIRNRCTN